MFADVPTKKSPCLESEYGTCHNGTARVVT